MQGSGPGGRIVSKDLLSIATQPLAAAVASPDGGDYTDIELSNMRKVSVSIRTNSLGCLSTHISV